MSYQLESIDYSIWCANYLDVIHKIKKDLQEHHWFLPNDKIKYEFIKYLRNEGYSDDFLIRRDTQLCHVKSLKVLFINEFLNPILPYEIRKERIKLLGFNFYVTLKTVFIEHRRKGYIYEGHVYKNPHEILRLVITQGKKLLNPYYDLSHLLNTSDENIIGTLVELGIEINTVKFGYQAYKAA